ncbi:Rv3654c family TadE-like protein [Streptomyces tremellae]|uniref:Putative Flp pilus-assembly TadG-like N-terminal domain-containing protein n=1 Tax=Streptomyces tremellae TaxID=1124239 RepID=A0ABP7FXY5_9ACTN
MVAAVLACALCALFGVLLALGQAVAARHRAGAAADLAALAAADTAPYGGAAACRRAERVAAAQGARLAACAVQGPVAEVTAVARVGPYAPHVRARAGPGAPAVLAASSGTGGAP